MMHIYTNHAGLKIPVDLYIVLPFSRQVVICKAGPATALESMRVRHVLNIALKWGFHRPTNQADERHKQLTNGPVPRDDETK